MSRAIALGGVTAALAVVLMSMGTMIPMTTFVWPMACMLLLCFVQQRIGRKMAWTWYVAVAILALLLTPDREAAALFVFLGWYPIVKLRIDSRRLRWVIKLLIFNLAILTMYWLLISLLGMEQLRQELFGDGMWATALILVLGNVTFLLLDRVLGALLRATI